MSTPMRRIRSRCCARAASGQAAAPPRPAMNSRRRRQMLIWPSRARELCGGRIAQACGGCQIGCCTAESRPPPPPGLWQRWVINRITRHEHLWSASPESGLHMPPAPARNAAFASSRVPASRCFATSPKTDAAPRRGPSWSRAGSPRRPTRTARSRKITSRLR
jgi:hypothetical protein